MMKYFFELILEDELSDLKRENKTKQCLIEIANEQINNLAKENQWKNSTIAKCNDEILREIKINSELLRDKRNLTLEVDALQRMLKKESEKCRELENTVEDLKNNLSKCQEALRKEKEEKSVLEIKNKNLEATFAELVEKATSLEVLNKELNEKLRSRDRYVLLLEAEVKVQKDHVEDIQEKMKVLKDQKLQAEDQLKSEQKLKVKIEKQKDALSSTIMRLSEDLDKAQLTVQTANEMKKAAELELMKLKIDFEEEQKSHMTAINHLKKRHAEAVEESSREIQSLFVAKSKLEKERLDQSSAYVAPVRAAAEVSKSMESPLTVDEKLTLESKRLSALRQRFRNQTNSTSIRSSIQ